MIRVLFFLMMLLLSLQPLRAGSATSDGSYYGKVVVIEVGEDALTSTQGFQYINRILKRAQEEKAHIVVFELNTPGGLAWETSELMMKRMQDLKLPTIAFVNTKAMSAGALIASACDKIYMAPISSIGAAGLISGTGEAMDPMLRKKAESAFDAFTRATVAEKGHSVPLIRAMMIPADADQTFSGVTVKKGELLTLTGREAAQLDADGKPLLAKGIAQSVDELLKQEGIISQVVVAEPTGLERIALWIAWASPFLILLGIAAIYFEFKTPGFGIGGIVAIIAFGLFFFGNNIAGNLAGYEMVALFSVGVILIVVEIFLLPGTIVPAALGLLCMLAALFGGMLNELDIHYLMESGEFNSDTVLAVTAMPFLKLVIGVVGGIIAIMLMMRYLPDLAMFRKLSNAVESGGAAGSAVVLQDIAIGDEGVTLTELKPYGKALINGRTCEVATQSEILDPETPIRVIKKSTFNVIVEKII